MGGKRVGVRERADSHGNNPLGWGIRSFRGADAESCRTCRSLPGCLSGRTMLRLHQEHNSGADEDKARAHRHMRTRSRCSVQIFCRHEEGHAPWEMDVLPRGMLKANRNGLSDGRRAADCGKVTFSGMGFFSRVGFFVFSRSFFENHLDKNRAAWYNVKAVRCGSKLEAYAQYWAMLHIEILILS